MPFLIYRTNDLIEQQMNAGIQHICGTDPVFNLISHSSLVHIGVGCAIVFSISFFLLVILFMRAALGILSNFGSCLLPIAIMGTLGSLVCYYQFSDEIVVSDSEYNQKFKTYKEQKGLYYTGIKACSQKVKEKWNASKSGEENIQKIKSEVSLAGDLK